MTQTTTALTFAAALGSGLMAGLFFAYSNSVLPALARVPGPQGMLAMNTINAVIQNPLFLLVFMGTAVVSLFLVVAVLAGWASGGSWWLIAGAAFYFVGCIVVTMAINVPMNDALAAAGPDSADGAARWAAYLDRWVFWNHIRAAACLGALGAFIVALR